MNEQALQDSFNLFATQGYKGDIDSYKKLISSNEEAFNDAFSLFSSNGYKGDSNQFKGLVGIENQVKTNDSASADPAVESTENMGSKSEEPLSAWQSIKNTFKKAGERIYDVVEFWGTDEGANSGLDIATNSFYSLLSSQEAVDEYAKNNPGWLSEGMGSEKTIDAIKKYKEEQDESNFATKGLVASAKEGDVGGLIAGAVEGLVNAFSSGVYFLGTAGTGVFSEVAAENYIAYNEQKAKNLGISLDELIKSGEADNLAPVGLGAVSVGLERFGFGKVLKATAGKNIIKNASAKLIYNRKARNVANILAAGGTEFTTEILQHATDKINEEFGRTAGTEEDAKFVQATFDAIFSEEGLESGLQGLIGGSGMTGIGTSYRAMNTIRTTVDGDLIDKNLEDLSKLRVKLNKATDKTEKAGIQKLVDTKISEIADSVRKGKDIYNNLSEGQLKEIENLTDLADVAASQVIELDKKLRAGEIDKSGYDLAYQGFKSEYDGVRQQLIDMNLEQNIKTAESITKEKGLDLDVMTTAEVEALMNSDKVSEQNKKDYFDNKSKGYDVSAFAIGKKIVIDKDIARKTGSINVGMHEVLHPVFNKLIGNAEQQGKMVRQFRRAMTSSQRRFVDAQMKERGYTGKEYNTEYVNVFSDALRKKQINYDKTTFEKIGDAIVSIFKPIGYTNIGFESGKDVYNFIKEFDQSAEQGKLTTKAAEALKGVDLSGAGLRDELQTSKTLSPDVETDLTSKILEVKKLAKENEEIAKKFGKDPIPGAKQIRLENEIRQGVKPIIEKVVTNRTKALYDPIAPDQKRNVSREEFQDSMRTDIETMILNEFKEGGNTLEKFIVDRSYLRANDLAKRLGIEDKIKASLSEVDSEGKPTIQIADDYDSGATLEEIRSEEGRQKKLINPLDIFSKDLSNEYQKEVVNVLSNMSEKDIKEFTFANLNDLAPEVTAKFWSTTVKKVTTASANLATDEIPGMQNIILENADTFIKLLPNGAILEGDTASEKLIGTGLGIPRKLQQAFYDQQERTSKGAGLIPFKLKDNITKKEFLEAFGINEDGTFEKFGGKDPRAQTILAIIRLYGKITSNTAVRQLADLTINEATDIKAGAAKIQFSKSLLSLNNINNMSAFDGAETITNIIVESKKNQAILDIQFSKQEEYSLKDMSKIGLGIRLKNKLEKSFNTEDQKKYDKLPENIRNIVEEILDTSSIKGNSILGFLYEILFAKKAFSIFEKNKLNGSVSQVAGYDSNSPDVIISKEIEDAIISIAIELKYGLDARFGQSTLGFDVDKQNQLIASLRSNRKKMDPSTVPGGVELMQAARKAIPQVKKILDFINKNEKLKGENKVTKFPLGISISKETWNGVRNLEAYKKLTKIETNLTEERIAFHYNAKGTYYINISGYGLYYLGKDINSIGVPKFTGFFTGRFRLKSNTKKDGKVSLTFVSEPIIKNKKEFAKSNINLDTEEGVLKLYNTMQTSKTLNEDFNNIIEDATGIKSFKRFSEAKGKVRGRDKGRFKFFIPPSADDFAGLLYNLTAKGAKGEAAQAWFKENLFDPFSRGINEFERYKQRTTTLMRDLKKKIKNVPEGLKKINETGFKNEDAVRIYLWAKKGADIPGLSKTDQKELIKIINDNPKLKEFAEQIDALVNGYPDPQNDWLAGTITTDIINLINTSKREEFLTEWQANVDEIFSKENINKLRAAFGDNYVEALQDMLYRMKNGRNRPYGANKLTNQFMNWVNDSVGTIMFFNTRSALLQTLSMANFINWGDNNPIMAAKAFANQKQFWSDFAMLFNSDFLKQRRSGLKNDVNADDIAAAAETSQNKAKAVLASILKMGFLPTQIADSFAIAMGGASFIRNRINTYVSKGMDQASAEKQAFLDFQEVTEESQQSSRPDRISQQQASPLGRIILAFANTPMQYMRLTKKAFLDLKNGRGDVKTNISKIAYYFAVQNIIFSSLQAALFSVLFEEEDDEEIDEKQLSIANSMLDSILRGVGIYGAIASTLKNVVLEVKKQSEKDRPDFTIAAQKALSLSPPVDSKMRKLMSAGRAFSYKTTREKMKGFGLDNPAYYAVGQVVSATTNIPVDRMVRKADNIRVALDNDTKYWQKIALLLGYSQWDVDLVETSKDKKEKSKFGSTTKWKKKTWKK